MKISYYLGVVVLLVISMQVFGMEQQEALNNICPVQEAQQETNVGRSLNSGHRNLGSNNLRNFFRIKVKKELEKSGEDQRSPSSTYRSLLNGGDESDGDGISSPARQLYLDCLENEDGLEEDTAFPVRQITVSPLALSRRLVVGSSSRAVSPQRCSPPAALGRLALQRVLSH